MYYRSPRLQFALEKNHTRSMSAILSTSERRNTLNLPLPQVSSKTQGGPCVVFPPLIDYAYSRGQLSSNFESVSRISPGLRAKGTRRDRGDTWRRKGVESRTRRTREQDEVEEEEGQIGEEEEEDLYGEIIEATKRTRSAT